MLSPLFASEEVIVSNGVVSSSNEKPISSGVTIVTARSLPSVRLERPSTTTVSFAERPL